MKLWTMRNGEQILICDMGDSHLINTIKMLRRNAGKTPRRRLLLHAHMFLQGEMALATLPDLEDEYEWDDSNPMLDYMEDEALKRGLEV